MSRDFSEYGPEDIRGILKQLMDSAGWEFICQRLEEQILGRQQVQLTQDLWEAEGLKEARVCQIERRSFALVMRLPEVIYEELEEEKDGSGRNESGCP